MLATIFWLTILAWPFVFFMGSQTKDLASAQVQGKMADPEWVSRQICLAVAMGAGVMLAVILVYVSLIFRMQEPDRQMLSAYFSAFAWSTMASFYVMIGVAIACFNLLNIYSDMAQEIQEQRERRELARIENFHHSYTDRQNRTI